MGAEDRKLFRALVHLLPRARAWAVTPAKTLRKFLVGLVGAPEDARDFVDLVYEDLFPDTTRELEEWEEQFGIFASDTESDRRDALAAAWAATGGQDPSYLQDIMQTAGFDIWIHEWWSSGPDPYVARDPRSYTEDPLIGGDVQCGEALAQCGEATAQCNRFLANEPGYIVNLDLTGNAQPPIPNDSTKWPYFLYWGGQVFGTNASILTNRRSEFERLLLKICPTQQWLVTMVDYVELSEGLVSEGGEGLVTEGGEGLETEGI